MKRALLVLLVVALTGGATARYLFFRLLERPGPPLPVPMRIHVAGAETVLAAFVGRFHSVFTPEMGAEAQKDGFSVHQIVTLASVIEKETAREEERPLVSAVFRNRLRLGMPLQADPTVIYGIENFNGNLTRRDLETRTPYNT